MRQSSEVAPDTNRPSSRSSRSAILAFGLLALLALIFYAPILLGVRTFPDGDFTHHFLPFLQYMAEAWRTLEAPLWNPYTYSGHPFWADVQAATLYPVSNLMLLATLPFKSASSRLYLLEVEAIAHVLLAGFFVFILARELTNRFWPSILAGISFMLSGYLIGYPPLQLAVLRTAIWLPLLLWLLLRAWQQPYRWRYWIAAAVVFASAFLAGHTQTWMFMAYATAGWIMALAFGTHAAPRESYGHRTVVLTILGVAAFAAMTVGLVAVQLIPSIEFSQLTVRADVDYSFLSSGFPLQDTWQMLIPGVLTHFSPLYVGVVAAGMALLGASAGLSYVVPVDSEDETTRRTIAFQRTIVGYFILLSLFGLLVSYGDNGFLYPILYRFVPGWDMFRGQERAAYLVAFGLSLLAAYGLVVIPAASRVFRRRYAMLFGALVTGAVYGFGLLWQLPDRTAVSDWHYLLLAVFTLLLAMSVAVTIWVDGWSVRREWLICGLAAVNLVVINAPINLVDRTPGEAVALTPEMEALRVAVESSPDASGLDMRVYNEFRIFEDYGMRTEIEDVWGSSPLRLTTYAALFDEFPLDRMFRLTGVGAVLTWRREMFEPSELLAEYPKQEDTTYLHRLLEPNPRVWIVDNTVSAHDAEAVELLADHEFDINHYAVLPSDYDLDEWSGSSNRGAVRVARPNANRLTVDVSGSGGGILIASENWLPGWRVENIECTPMEACDSEAVHASGLSLFNPVRANLSFLAVALPEGEVRFDLVYDPASVRLGTAISVATLLLLLVAVTVHLVIRRRRAVG